MLEDVRIAVLDLDVPPLLGNHVEERPAPQPVGLAHHVQVARGDVPHAALEDTERALSRLVLRERGLDLLADHQRHELLPALGGARLRRGGGHVALVAVAHGKHDADAAPEVVEDVLDGAWCTARRQAIQPEPEVLALVANVDGRIPPSVGLLLLDPGARRCDVGAADGEIRPARQGTSGCLDPVSRKWSRVQLPAQDEWRVGRHAGQRSQLERDDLHPARQHLPARLQAVDLDELQALVERA